MNEKLIKVFGIMLTMFSVSCVSPISSIGSGYTYPQVKSYKLGPHVFDKSKWPTEPQVVASIGPGKYLKTKSGHKRVYKGQNCDQVEIFFEVDPQTDVSSISFSGISSKSTTSSGTEINVLYTYNFVSTNNAPSRKMKILEKNLWVRAYGGSGCRVAKISTGYYREWDEKNGIVTDVKLHPNGKFDLMLTW